jgi:hypothetical protein
MNLNVFACVVKQGVDGGWLAGSLGSNGEDMEGAERVQQAISGRAEREPGIVQDASFATGLQLLPCAAYVRSGEGGTGRGRAGPSTSDIATSHPRLPPSPSASNASCGQAPQCDGGNLPAVNSFDSRIPNPQACPFDATLCCSPVISFLASFSPVLVAGQVIMCGQVGMLVDGVQGQM